MPTRHHRSPTISPLQDWQNGPKLGIFVTGDSDGMPPQSSSEPLHASLLALVACPAVAAPEQCQRDTIALTRSHHWTRQLPPPAASPVVSPCSTDGGASALLSSSNGAAHNQRDKRRRCSMLVALSLLWTACRRSHAWGRCSEPPSWRPLLPIQSSNREVPMVARQRCSAAATVARSAWESRPRGGSVGVREPASSLAGTAARSACESRPRAWRGRRLGRRARAGLELGGNGGSLSVTVKHATKAWLETTPMSEQNL